MSISGCLFVADGGIRFYITPIPRSGRDRHEARKWITTGKQSRLCVCGGGVVGKRSQEFSITLPAQISAYRQPLAFCLTWRLCGCVEFWVSQRRQVCVCAQQDSLQTAPLSFEYLSSGAFLCFNTFYVFGGGEHLWMKLCCLHSFHPYGTLSLFASLIVRHY